MLFPPFRLRTTKLIWVRYLIICCLSEQIIIIQIFRSDLTIQTFVKLDCNLISNHMAVVWIQFVNNAFHVCLFFSSIQTTNIWTDLSLIQNLISVACLNKWWSMFQWFILLSQFFYNVMHLTMFRSIQSYAIKPFQRKLSISLFRSILSQLILFYIIWW